MKILVTAIIDVPDMSATETEQARLETTVRRRLAWDGTTIEALTATAYDPAPRPDFTATDVGQPDRPAPGPYGEGTSK